MKKTTLLIAGVSVVLAGCATMYSAADYQKMAKDAVSSSFVEKGIAKKERINQDAINLACSQAEMNGTPLSGEVTRKLEGAEFATISIRRTGSSSVTGRLASVWHRMVGAAPTATRRVVRMGVTVTTAIRSVRPRSPMARSVRAYTTTASFAATRRQS